MRRPDLAARRGVGLTALVAGLCGLFLLALTSLAAAQTSGPKFPPLTGRVVDGANILSAAQEAELTRKLEALETSTGRQLVVATAPSLQGYEIEEYGYRLGRAWGIGGEKADDGLILLVAPAEKRVRIEVGYGLEGVVTDALSSRILSERVLPRFRAGDFPGGIEAGADSLIELLSLPDAQARARVEAAERQPAGEAQRAGGGLSQFVISLILFLVIMAFLRGVSGRRRRGRAGDWIGPALVCAASHRGGGRSSGGGGSGGGGFSGGGGSFGGGGASGSW